MTDEKKAEKPHGWVAWHTIDGTAPSIPESAKDAEWDLGYQHWSSSEESVEEAAARKISQGWRIRPVKLVFLDEPPTPSSEEEK